MQRRQKVLFKSPGDVLQINTLNQQLGLRSQLKEWYQDATSVPYDHLIFDFTPKTVVSLRYCSSYCSVPTKFFLPSGKETKFSDNEYTKRLFSPNISKIFSKTSKIIHSELSKRFHSVSERVFSKYIRRRASRFLERRRSKISNKLSELTQKNSSTQKKNHFKFNYN